jgi:hypothetical protein
VCSVFHKTLQSSGTVSVDDLEGGFVNDEAHNMAHNRIPLISPNRMLGDYARAFCLLYQRVAGHESNDRSEMGRCPMRWSLVPGVPYEIEWISHRIQFPLFDPEEQWRSVITRLL